MPRKAFQQELDQLVSEVVELGEEVGKSLESMAQAIQNRDAPLASKEIGSDARYKRRGMDIDSECMVLQARQAPVAGDLRLIYTILSVTNHLVRAGTLCEHICKAMEETAGQERNEDLEAVLIAMARAASNLFKDGLEVFKSCDIERARSLRALDDEVDLLYSEALNLVANPSSDGRSGSPEWRMRAALMVHYLERIADHGVDIGTSTIFLVTGERIEDAMRQYLDRELGEK